MISPIEGTRKTAVCAFSADAVIEDVGFSVPCWKVGPKAERWAVDEGLVERGGAGEWLMVP